ncbi:MAG: hypothetical protein SF182_11110, partial [Deltaproteobacteria bacterium]|nr:hypothetical protein [Deltaproteobacteria bacterium]
MRIPGPVAVAALVLAAATGRAAPLVTLTTPAVLDTLNDRGCDAGSLAFGAPAATTAALAETTGWRAIAATMAADLHALSDGDPQYGIGMRYAHRGF